MGSSGSKQSKSKKKKAVQKHSNLPDHLYELLAKSLRSLPYPEGAITHDMIQAAATYTEELDAVDQQEIIKKGQRSKGLYIVVKGEAEVLSSTGEVIASLTTGSLIGELSTLFYIPCTATVRIPAKASLLLIRAEKLRQALKDQVVSMSLSDYFVSKRYFDTNGIIKEPDVLSQQITKSILKEMPMFSAWGEQAIDDLIEGLKKGGDPVLLVPTKSFLINEGDPADEIVIVARGRVEVLKEKGLIAELDAARWPICLGEEGLFTSNKSLVSVRSRCPCTAIIIKNALINEIAEKHKDAGTADYTERIDRWTVRPGMDEESPIRVKYGAHIILPVLLKKLGDTPLLFEAPLSLVYSLAMDCEITQRADAKVIMGKSALARRKSSKLVRNEIRQESDYMKPQSPSKHGVALPTLTEGEEITDAFRIPPEGEMTVQQAEETFEDSDKFLVVLKGAMVLGENSDWTCSDGEMLCKLSST
ncbi:uncharacterized protein [Amphiura filiformis]|uniref:uncharacterized protein n=1 Tax=Amphiura filiformis TaxID=82378 RepID=UPI003B21E961